MFWRLGIVLAVASYVLAVGQCVAAARQGARNTADEAKTVPEYSISGVVVEATTGKPVGHALVMLSIYEDSVQRGEPPIRRVMTDEDGKFEIRGITVVGRAGIDASKPGYHSVREIRIIPGHTMSSYQEVTLEPGAVVRVELKPEATIEGRVVDEGGEPIEGLPIHLTFDGALNGRRVLQELRRGVVTDEEGEFRFADMQSGRYFVSAGPSKEVSARTEARGRTALGYATVFYGGGSDFASASPIDLIPGKHADADLRMELQPQLKVRGVISGGAVENSTKITIFDSANQRVLQNLVESSDQEILIAELPAGSYTIHVSRVDPESRDCAATVKRLLLTREISGLQLALAPCATITVNVRVEQTKQDANKTPSTLDQNGVVRAGLKYVAQASLRPDDERGSTPIYHAGPEKDDPNQVILHGVEPGRYILEVPLMRRVYVESMQSGMTDLLREDFVVASGAAVPPVEVRLRDDAATLDGKVSLDPDVKAAAVVAVPEGTPRRATTAMVNSGKFQFPPLAPGRYELFAVDQLDDFAYSEQDVIGKYLAHAKEVTLRPNERTTVELEFVRVGREGQQ